MNRQETFTSDLAPGEPAPPASGELFAGHEVAAFESFLDNLATDNEYLFHPKVPASLSWNGFHTTKNQGFEEFKHSGLQFGSDKHFSPTNGYIARHKYVPVGYGHVHPQSSAQRSQRSSTSSRTPSRRPSVIYTEQTSDGPKLFGASPSSSAMQHGMLGNGASFGAHDSGDHEIVFSSSKVPHEQHRLVQDQHRVGRSYSRGQGESSAQTTSPRQDFDKTTSARLQFRTPGQVEQIDAAAAAEGTTTQMHKAREAAATTPNSTRDRSSMSSDAESRSEKRIKLEEGLSLVPPKQPLTAGTLPPYCPCRQFYSRLNKAKTNMTSAKETEPHILGAETTQLD
jgi:hypothetical protein